jgi:hypothetical protein
VDPFAERFPGYLLEPAQWIGLEQPVGTGPGHASLRLRAPWIPVVTSPVERLLLAGRLPGHPLEPAQWICLEQPVETGPGQASSHRLDVTRCNRSSALPPWVFRVSPRGIYRRRGAPVIHRGCREPDWRVSRSRPRQRAGLGQPRSFPRSFSPGVVHRRKHPFLNINISKQKAFRQY